MSQNVTTISFSYFSEDKAFREKYGDDIIISHIPKQKETLGKPNLINNKYTKF